MLSAVAVVPILRKDHLESLNSKTPEKLAVITCKNLPIASFHISGISQ